MSEHFIPLLMHGQPGSWQDLAHLQARSSSTASGAGGPSIQSIVRSSWPSRLKLPPKSNGTWNVRPVFQAPLPYGCLIIGCLCMFKQSAHGGNWCDSISPFLLQNSWYRKSFTLMSSELDPYNWQVNLSSLENRTGERFHPWPSTWKISCTDLSVFSIFKALIFPCPTKALTESQSVKAWSPGIPLHTPEPQALQTLLVNLVRVQVPHFTKRGAWITSLKARQSRNTSVSSEVMTTALPPDFAAWEAWSRSLLSASSWCDSKSGISSLVSFVIL